MMSGLQGSATSVRCLGPRPLTGDLRRRKLPASRRYLWRRHLSGTGALLRCGAVGCLRGEARVATAGPRVLRLRSPFDPKKDRSRTHACARAVALLLVMQIDLVQSQEREKRGVVRSG